MGRILLVVLLVVMMFTGVQAQEDSTDCREVGRDWYEEVMSNAEIEEAFARVLNAELSPSARFGALQEFRDLAAAAEEADYPSCVHTARTRFLAGLESLARGGEAWLDDDVLSFLNHVTAGYQSIGEARGYLIAQQIRVQPRTLDVPVMH
jgi:hypothetical protein